MRKTCGFAMLSASQLRETPRFARFANCRDGVVLVCSSGFGVVLFGLGVCWYGAAVVGAGVVLTWWTEGVGCGG